MAGNQVVARKENVSGVLDKRRIHQPFAAPYANDGDLGVLASIHDPIRRELELAKPWRLELRDDPSAVGELHELLDLRDDRDDQACTDLGRLLR